MPMAGWVFVLDGVLIGAGDGRFLAWAGMATLVVYVPFALAVREAAPPGAAGLAWLWAAFAGVFMLARAVTTGLARPRHGLDGHGRLTRPRDDSATKRPAPGERGVLRQAGAQVRLRRP